MQKESIVSGPRHFFLRDRSCFPGIFITATAVRCDLRGVTGFHKVRFFSYDKKTYFLCVNKSTAKHMAHKNNSHKLVTDMNIHEFINLTYEYNNHCEMST